MPDFHSQILVEQAGNPYRLYHRSSATIIEQFHPFSHFGSKEAASAKGGEEGRMYEVILNIKNPLLMKDAGTWKHAGSIQKAVIATGAFSAEEAQHVFGNYDRFGMYAGTLSADEIASEFKSRPDYPARQQAKHNLWCVRLMNLLEQKGYDGIAYVNSVEDRGHTSLINFKSSQVHIQEPETTPAPASRRFDWLRNIGARFVVG